MLKMFSSGRISIRFSGQTVVRERGTGKVGERKSKWETGKREREIYSGRREVMRESLLNSSRA